ncbi:MAG: acetyl-CoA carboxylase biotin carboxyl carrier protein [Holosporales bacterium]|jgi:acetyl-CoA carboxylase biotin carboxyl carrier protein|nr:acetyl-CoA carboxylase biotin carboxyl carrier protein [Holosporales bacterium]
MDNNKTRIDAESVRSLAILLEETGLSEIEYQLDSLRIRVTKGISVTNNAVTIPVQQPATPLLQEPVQIAPGGSSSPKDSSAKATEESENEIMAEAIKSPMVGVVYIAPSPGTEPFVRLGDKVSEGQTLLVIEAMKVMNMIKAPKVGIVKNILVKDRQPVEYDEPLIVVV